ncbi:glycosyltransferase involved in cell wall biosynthesis [Aquamicrobium defluvii]|uniref:Glycosyltransferase involved in cell wall biosynthesis n=1 Tax=Aquamicrobium defluvii TaxID=69279 RepID=A0A4R6YFA7_9HYPH|nr:glycosyltransferase involved in cell wall biosynthesis [Aquamicrobium defluvii]
MTPDGYSSTSCHASSLTATRASLLLSINTSWNIVNFRTGLVRTMVAQCFKVAAASPDDTHTARLAEIGCRHISLAIDNRGTNPVKDAGLFLRYLGLMLREKPDVYLSWTIKPNIYGSLAAHILRVPVICNVSGLGTTFLHDGWLTRFVKLLYRVAFSRSAVIFFQNRDDLDLFVESRLVRPEQVCLLPGSGIDLDRFAPAPIAPREADDGPVFILVARLLWDKGIREYVEAARRIKARMPQVRFRLLGFLDVENRTAVPRQAVENWVQEGIIEYLGQTNDVRPHLADADCVVLPSYREGTPRSLLEAAAMARPLIATDVPGCREVVDDGVNGWLCKAKDTDDLVDKMLRFAESSGERRLEMGLQSRLKAERQFNERIVIDAYLAAIEQILARRGSS